jgi:SAM-dependent methyltransferase
MESGAKQHVDIGSDVKFVGMLTTITNVTFVDIRPLEIKLKGFISKCGSIVALPFDDRSISSLSSMHVIEHVGLGRYGDPIDPLGTVRACKELSRVLAPGGKLYLSVPIGESKVQFNGQRIFAIEEIVRLFNGLRLVEFSFVDTDGTYRENAKYPSVKLRDDTGQDAGLGLFLFEAIQTP